jgi:hypothetical protein
MLKHFRIAGLIVAMAGVSTLAAEAGPIQGDFSITGNFLPVSGQTGVKTTLALATGLDFINFFGTTATPGVAGIVNVNAASGDFSPLTGTSGTIKDFTFSGTGSTKFPTVSVLSFQNYAMGVAFDLLTVSIVLQNSAFLVLSGTGVFHMNGLTDTAGTFDFSGNGSRSTFSFSSSQAGATIPEPASLFVLAVGLLSGGGYLRRRMPRATER